VADVPAVVRNKALTAGAAQWLEDLPDLVAQLEREWSITVGRPYDGATEAFVAQAVMDDGTPAVLKLIVPRPGEAARAEITALRLVNGQGCVRLLRADAAGGALLLERLGRSLHQLALACAARRIDAHDDERAVIVHGDVHQWNALEAAGGPRDARRG
jgi:streptomycin 6-kinase